MDQHILAEYYELPRIFALVHKHTMKGRDLSELSIPDSYRLGKGHMSFFYDKLAWLAERHNNLREEGDRRGLKLSVDPDAACIELNSFRHTEFWGDYTITPEAMEENRQRLADKIAMYPHWYTYERITFSDFK